MGLFDFVKDAGQKLAGLGKDDAADNAAKVKSLTQAVTTLGLKIEDMKIHFDDGIATVTGVAPSQEEREKVVLVLGNTAGVAQVNDKLRVEKPEPEATLYTVQAGDSLSKIAKAHYGDPMKYMAIFEANKPMLKDPNKIYPGQVLRIPPRS